MAIQHPLSGNERGIGLFEVTLILAAAVLLTAALAPAVLRTIHGMREDAARDEMRTLYRAMVGSDEDRTYGFVGDLGRLPFITRELLAAEGLPLFIAADASGVGYGWNGPYVNRGDDEEDAILDPWGNPYDIGVVGPGQLRSAGPSGLIDDGDDIVYPPSPVLPWGTLLVSIKGHSDEIVDTDPEGCVVTLGFSQDGTYMTVVDTDTPYSFSDVHRGLHTVEVACPRFDGGTATETAVARVAGVEQQLIELHVALGAGAGVGTGDADADPAEAADATGSATDASLQR